MATKPSELDPDVAGSQLMFILGAAATGMPLDAELRRTLWRLLPYVKAVCQCGREHSGLRSLWWRELQEPGPFGLPFEVTVDESGLPSIADDVDKKNEDDI